MKPNLYYDNTDLIPMSPEEEAEAAAQEQALLVVGQSSGFLPRVQLFGGSSDLVKEGKIGVGLYGLVRGKDQLEILGPEVNTLVCRGRVKALDLSGDNPITSYDHNSDVFKAIMTGSEAENSRKMYGPEYLLWLPGYGFATFFLSSPTARKQSSAIHARLRKAATLKAELIRGKKFKWHGPLIVPCSTPFEMPNTDALNAEIHKFNNPVSSQVEVAEEAGDEQAV